MKTTRKRRILIAAMVIVVLLICSFIGLYVLAASIYDSNFNFRCTSSADISFDISQFPAMTRQRHTFTSNSGQRLVGYLYQQPETAKKAVVVFAHGFGAGGQIGYMDIFDYLTSQGYYVFAYDATGNDESEGDVIGGLPQGFIDLDYAIDYVYTVDEIRELPLVLMGYSWGGLSVANVLNYHPEVKAVASLAGCNRSLNLIEYHGCQMVGNVAKLLLPFVSLHEYVLYGNYASSTALKGFANSDCDVLIVHGKKDRTVPIEYGYDTYYEKYGTDERFSFMKILTRDHDLMDLSNGTRDFALMAEIVEFFDKSLAKQPAA